MSEARGVPAEPSATKNGQPDRGGERRIVLRERTSIPPIDIALASLPMVPLVVGAVAAWSLTGEASSLAIKASVLWAAAILLFLSGVRRGLSFRTENGPTLTQLSTILVMFGLGAVALGAAWHGALAVALSSLLIGFAIVWLLDPVAAAHGEVPPYFARLRRLQMPFAILPLAAVLARLLAG